MVFTPPTSTDFFARFTPKFATVNPTKIDLILAEALTQVDDSWVEEDRFFAILYLTAHLLVMETAASADRTGSIMSESFGPISFSYGGGGDANSRYGGTEYGRRFAEYQRQNFPGVLVV